MPRRMFEGCLHALQHKQRRTMQKQKQRWKLLGVAARGLDGGIDGLHHSSRSSSICSTHAHRPPNRYPPLLLLLSRRFHRVYRRGRRRHFQRQFCFKCRRFRHRVCRRFRLCRRCQRAIASLPLPLSPQPPPPPTFACQLCFISGGKRSYRPRSLPTAHGGARRKHGR